MFQFPNRVMNTACCSCRLAAAKKGGREDEKGRGMTQRTHARTEHVAEHLDLGGLGDGAGAPEDVAAGLEEPLHGGGGLHAAPPAAAPRRRRHRVRHPAPLGLPLRRRGRGLRQRRRRRHLEVEVELRLHLHDSHRAHLRRRHLHRLINQPAADRQLGRT